MFTVTYGLFAQSSISVANDSILVWKEQVRLTWNDFKGPKNVDYFGRAQTSHKIEILPTNVMVDENNRIQGYENLTVEAHFYKYKSWSNTTSLNVLKHEQLHFDIAELFARKIKRKFDELKVRNEANFEVYWGEYSKLWSKCRSYQIQYDSDTKHGNNKDRNVFWYNKIASELLDLKAYK
jgi:hypothetical protein